MLDALTFFPTPHDEPPPPAVVERWLTAADGVRIHAWHAVAGQDAPTLVWSHGNAGNIAMRADVLSALRSRGLDVLAYDYRGYGKSEGTPSETGVYLDAAAAYDALRADGVPPGRIVAFGESLGAAVSIELAVRRPCAGLALVSPFTTLAEVARVHYGPLGYIAGGRFDSLSRLPAIDAPLLLAHGTEDSIVPLSLGERLFAASRGRKRFLRISGAGHNDILDREELLAAIEDFAREIVVRRPRSPPEE